MAQTKIYGRVVDIFEPRTGTNKNGEPWQFQDIVIEETDGEYTQPIGCTIDNYKITQEQCDILADSLQNGNMVTASVNISGREYTKMDGTTAYSVNLKVWKIEDGDTRESKPRQSRPSDQPLTISVNRTTELPFG